ncbi:hypothetical protein CEXT_643421 [Caerostris extrusa]|uniref:Uncharacterized protein n=1 Tax=Caerostris extrusa TaxID=172846 RepID=A0AAV4RIF8_CAEEX|nr:hypothetical protein CEXT_643421 [Caerostris extrusa]
MGELWSRGGAYGMSLSEEELKFFRKEFDDEAPLTNADIQMDRNKQTFRNLYGKEILKVGENLNSPAHSPRNISPKHPQLLRLITNNQKLHAVTLPVRAQNRLFLCRATKQPGVTVAGARMSHNCLGKKRCRVKVKFRDNREESHWEDEAAIFRRKKTSRVKKWGSPTNKRRPKPRDRNKQPFQNLYGKEIWKVEQPSNQELQLHPEQRRSRNCLGSFSKKYIPGTPTTARLITNNQKLHAVTLAVRAKNHFFFCRATKQPGAAVASRAKDEPQLFGYISFCIVLRSDVKTTKLCRTSHGCQQSPCFYTYSLVKLRKPFFLIPWTHSTVRWNSPVYSRPEAEASIEIQTPMV